MIQYLKNLRLKSGQKFACYNIIKRLDFFSVFLLLFERYFSAVNAYYMIWDSPSPQSPKIFCLGQFFCYIKINLFKLFLCCHNLWERQLQQYQTPATTISNAWIFFLFFDYFFERNLSAVNSYYRSRDSPSP